MKLLMILISCDETDLPEEGLEPVQGFLQYLHHLEALFWPRLTPGDWGEDLNGELKRIIH